MNIAVIPARGGSKRIPGKNIRSFGGKPMIAWSIEAALRSELFERVLVSTDDAAIAKVASSYGAEVPFWRPDLLSDDYTDVTAVVEHAVRWMHSERWEPESVCCIYATTPFISTEDLLEGQRKLKTGSWHYVLAATEFAAPVYRSFRLKPDGGVEMLFPEHFETRSQDLPVVLHDAAHFCWGRPAAWLERARIFDTGTCTHLVPRWRVVDIDTEEDWQYAELLWAVLRGAGMHEAPTQSTEGV